MLDGAADRLLQGLDVNGDGSTWLNTSAVLFLDGEAHPQLVQADQAKDRCSPADGGTRLSVACPDHTRNRGLNCGILQLRLKLGDSGVLLLNRGLDDLDLLVGLIGYCCRLSLLLLTCALFGAQTL